MSLLETLGNNAWMQANADKIRAALPAAWEPCDQGLMLRIGYRLKLINVDWRSQQELANCFVYFEKTGLMERIGSKAERQVVIRRRQAGVPA